MAKITPASPATNFAKLLPRDGLFLNGSCGIDSSAVLGLPRMVTRGKLRCSLQEKPPASGEGSNASMVASMAGAAWAVTTSATWPAMALVDDRLSTEGTGLPFGLSNNLLGWILFGVFGLIWSLYFIYTTSLEEDDDSGLSL
ncbi:photosystem II reaction center W protein, chloroplastic-like [Corylus avellana]|uniref:photosystem II reaction center W protein, chloroplastic-like n=1 Tax=Corylus avellana TaxID=13451 RepID=UPI001E21A728|nr:photosystem II reaction center W protein, chloroplastic-like [Corylus avellana]